MLLDLHRPSLSPAGRVANHTQQSPSDEPTPSSCCRFDGLTQLHEFSVEGGGVRYRSRHLYPALEAHIRKRV